MPRRWTRTITAAALATLVALLGINSVEPQPAAAQGNGPLAQVLGNVPEDSISRTQIWYSAPGELENILGFAIGSRADIDQLGPAQQIAFLSEFGQQVFYSAFSGVDNGDVWASTFGFNPFNIDYEYLIGAQLPDQYAILRGGFDTGAVVGALQALGFTETDAGFGPYYTIGADDTYQTIADSRYNRLMVSPDRILAAPSDRVIAGASSGGASILDNPAYGTLVEALEGRPQINGSLLSAALFDGGYLIDTVIGGPGQGMPLPRYETAGIGYWRGPGYDDRAVAFALVYADLGTAEAASGVLVERLSNYQSQVDPGSMPFVYWPFNVTTGQAASGYAFVVAWSQVPAETDVSWVQMILNGDLGFFGAG